MEEIKLNSHCVNAKIKYHILSDEKMKEIGFNKNYYEGTDHEEYSPYWWFTRMIQFPKPLSQGRELKFRDPNVRHAFFRSPSRRGVN